MTGRELEITPEPTPGERAAIEAALAKRLPLDEAEPGAWWQAGINEAVTVDDDAVP